MGDDGAMEVRRPDGSVIAVEVAGQPGAVPVLLCHGHGHFSILDAARPILDAARPILAPARPS
jgi:hypothetical protein